MADTKKTPKEEPAKTATPLPEEELGAEKRLKLDDETGVTTDPVTGVKKNRDGEVMPSDVTTPVDQGAPGTDGESEYFTDKQGVVYRKPTETKPGEPAPHPKHE